MCKLRILSKGLAPVLPGVTLLHGSRKAAWEQWQCWIFPLVGKFTAPLGDFPWGQEGLEMLQKYKRGLQRPIPAFNVKWLFNLYSSPTLCKILGIPNIFLFLQLQLKPIKSSEVFLTLEILEQAVSVTPIKCQAARFPQQVPPGRQISVFS